jgi:putative ABC transport system permease protein
MQIREGIRLAFHQIVHDKLKSAFTLLGVIIGVMFLIVVVSVVEGIDRFVTDELAPQVFGINTITVRRAASVQVERSAAQRLAVSRRAPLTPRDADAIRSALTVPARVGVESSTGGEVRTWEGLGAGNVQIIAISPEVLEIRSMRIAAGRPFSPEEAELGASVVILGSSVAASLFPESDPLDQRVRIRNHPFRVVGVLEAQGGLLSLAPDSRVVIPARSATRFLSNPRAVSSVIIQTLDPADVPIALADAEGALRVARRLRPEQSNDFSLETAESSMAEWNRIATVLFLALPGLVGISLVVGGIVIMNIMLVSVMQRTREIGVRKALGARRRDVVAQFLVESTALSGIGAAVGTAIGLVITWGVRVATPLPAAVAFHWVALGILLGMGVGVIAGVYPATRASRLDPVVALRHE